MSDLWGNSCATAVGAIGECSGDCPSDHQADKKFFSLLMEPRRACRTLMGMGDQGKPDKDSDLWPRVLDGDGSAFAELFVLHRDRVFGHSLRLVRTSHEAEDITAMVFLEAWRCRSSVRLVNGSIIGWLLVTTTNVARNRIRSNLRYEQLIRKLPRVETAPDHGDSVADAVDQDRRSQLLHRAYRSLGRRDQEIIALCVLEEMSTTEVSQLLCIPPGTVKSRLSRAKQKLAQLLNPQAGLRTTSPLTPEEGTP